MYTKNKRVIKELVHVIHEVRNFKKLIYPYIILRNYK